MQSLEEWEADQIFPSSVLFACDVFFISRCVHDASRVVLPTSSPLHSLFNNGSCALRRTTAGHFMLRGKSKCCFKVAFFL